MRTPEQNEQSVLDFFKGWEPGVTAMAEAYRFFLAEDVLYENAGLPPCRGLEAAVAFMEASCQLPGVDFQTIRVEVRHIVAAGNVVFNERIDRHYRANGEVALMPRLCGVMEFDDDGKIRRWADYFDPASWPSQS